MACAKEWLGMEKGRLVDGDSEGVRLGMEGMSAAVLARWFQGVGPRRCDGVKKGWGYG